MSRFAALSTRVEQHVVVAFVDLAGFAMQSTRVADDEIAAVIDGYYELVASRIAAARGHVVKFIGDGVLVVFDRADADAGVDALLALKTEIDDYLARHRWECRTTIKIHAGPVIAGPYGGAGAKRFDVIGKTVNTAAMLDASGVALSAEAFRTLSPPLRQRFKKHTWPVTYIRVEDPHRFRKR
ncbi:MAG TPA: adenylate/guanylate cyclase domain-containing protein [Kofleriaceae bacterium]|nr:adenylate/guanylate cyclase domain-containing protein [Kofleriaceae bacterium]